MSYDVPRKFSYQPKDRKIWEVFAPRNDEEAARLLAALEQSQGHACDSKCIRAIDLVDISLELEK